MSGEMRLEGVKSLRWESEGGTCLRAVGDPCRGWGVGRVGSVVPRRGRLILPPGWHVSRRSWGWELDVWEADGPPGGKGACGWEVYCRV